MISFAGAKVQHFF